MKQKLILGIFRTNSTIRSYLMYLSILLLLSTSCKNETAINVQCECQKDEPKFCTDQYVMISVYLKDQTGVPLALDEYTVKKARNEQIVIYKSKPYDLPPGYYPILTDSQQELTNTCGEEFEFTGTKDEKQVVATRFIIAHDCCHVIPLEGEKEIRVNI